MMNAEAFCFLLLSASICISARAAEHHTRHSMPKYLTSCPVACQCIINDHYLETVDVTCQNRLSFGIELPPFVTSLFYVNISTPFMESSNIVPTSYDGGSDMLKIVYKQSGIQTISPSTFKKLPYLDHLDLSQNLIKEIPEKTFDNLIRLRVLNLTDNKLETLPDELFKDQQQLKELYLAKNNLNTTYFNVYSNCDVLKVLDLSFNEIKEIHANNSFNPSLVTLLLNNNEIKNISTYSFSKLKNLETLDLANNKIHFISNEIFKNLYTLENLDLEENEIITFPKNTFDDLLHLKVLKISKNPITFIDGEILKNNLDLNILMLSETLISQINAGLLSRLKRLRVLNASNNNQLIKIEDFKFSSSNHLQYIDLSHGNLSSLPIFISHLEMVEQLRLEGNPWNCGCTSGWFIQWLNNHQHAVNTSLTCDGSENMIEKLVSLNCEAPKAVNETSNLVLQFRSTVVLSCLFYGEPTPSITWITPSGYIFHYNNNNSSDLFSKHPRIHLYNLEPVADSRVKMLNNGSLEIEELLRQDAGIYTCIAVNSVGNDTSHIVITLDRKTFFHIKIMCIVVGASCVLTVLMCTAIGQFIYWLCKRCGLIEERDEQLFQLRENIDIYKSQQLQNLRENYTQQVHKIKENCALQVEWIRESYRGQVKHIRDFRQYGSHQFSSMRDQYYDQMKKVRDYSTTQLGWVRENYVFQRNRIQKFSSHQVLRFRESYKYQQQTLNKILENLPNLYLENCRGSSCGRSESSVFVENKDQLDIEDVFEVDAHARSTLEELTDPSVLDEALDDQSLYYTPSELSESPQSPPLKEIIFKKRKHDVKLLNDIHHPDNNPLDRPSTSYSAIPWLQESPCHIFHCSQSGIHNVDIEDEFQVPRTLQTSTSLPEMPQVCVEDERNLLGLSAGCSHETSL